MGLHVLDDVIAGYGRGCQFAIGMANDRARLAEATFEQLSIAATFLARALAPFDDVPIEITSESLRDVDARVISAQATAALRQLEAAGQGIGAEMKRRAERVLFVKSESTTIPSRDQPNVDEAVIRELIAVAGALKYLGTTLPLLPSLGQPTRVGDYVGPDHVVLELPADGVAAGLNGAGFYLLPTTLAAVDAARERRAIAS